MEMANGTLLAAIFVEHILYILLMVALLAGSAFFSGSETAFFHLSQRTVRQFGRSDRKIERLTATTLANPSQLLTALLFGNMLVNVLYFALTSIISFQLTRSSGPAAGTLAATGGFALLLLFGEMLPKSLAYANARQFCLCATPACYLFLKALGPLLSAKGHQPQKSDRRDENCQHRKCIDDLSGFLLGMVKPLILFIEK